MDEVQETIKEIVLIRQKIKDLSSVMQYLQDRLETLNDFLEDNK